MGHFADGDLADDVVVTDCLTRTHDLLGAESGWRRRREASAKIIAIIYTPVGPNNRQLFFSLLICRRQCEMLLFNKSVPPRRRKKAALPPPPPQVTPTSYSVLHRNTEFS